MKHFDRLTQAGRARPLLVILGVSTILKLGLAVVVARTSFPVLDEADYLQLANGLTEGRGFEGTFRPPAYPLFLHLLHAGAGTLPTLIMQVLISAVTVVLVHRITVRSFGRGPALVAAGLVAFDPLLMAFTHRLWSETLYLPLFLGGIVLMLEAADNESARPWLLAGVMFGLAGLARAAILTFMPILLPWLVAVLASRDRTTWRAWAAWRGALRRTTLVAVTSCAVVLPWTVRNYAVTGAFVLVDTNGAFNVHVGNQPEAAFVDKDDSWSYRYGLVDDVAFKDLELADARRAQAGALEEARRNIAADPVRFVKKFLWEAGHLFSLDSFLLRHMRNGWYGILAQPFTFPLVTVISVGFFVVLMLAGVAGLASGPPSPVRSLTWLLVLHSIVLFGLTYSLSRYSIPLRPVLAVFASVALGSPSTALGGLRRALSGRAVVPIAAFALVVLAAWGRDLPLIWDMIVDGGRGHVFRMELPPQVP